jgi:hypothetical protein
MVFLLISPFQGSHVCLSDQAALSCHMGKISCGIQLDVPDCEGLKYLPESQVDSLRLQSLGYKTEALLVCNEYIFALNHLNSGSLAKCGGAVVTVHPGIGMNLLLITVILLTLA